MSRESHPDPDYDPEAYAYELRRKRRARRRARERAARRRRALLIRLGLGILLFFLLAWGLVFFLTADREGPTAEAVSQTIRLGDAAPEPEAFVTNLQDNEEGEITVAYVKEPDLTQGGTQEVVLLLTDAHRNKTELTAELTILTDVTAPEISGVQEISIYEGENISYKAGITISDDTDSEDQLTLEIDNSQVDPYTAGVYPVTYRVTDTAGNVTEESTTVTVINKEQEEIQAEEERLKPEVEELAKKAVKECKESGQTKEELLFAMLLYVKHNMEYNGKSEKGREYYEAYRAFTKGAGDCYTYFAMLKSMMEAAGFETIDVCRINGETNHYWSLVKLNGNWYHIDSCPRSEKHYKYWYCFLRTDEELEEFSTDKAEGYYTFDTSLYPSTPTAEEAASNLKRDKILSKYLKSIGHTDTEH